MDGINWGGLAQQRNIFADFAGGMQAGAEMRDADAKRKAMNLFATDPEAAEQALISAGDFQTAEAMRKRREGMREEQTRKAVGAKVGSGDLAGARTAAAEAGDFDLVTSIAKMDEAQRKSARESAEVLGAYAYSLRQMPYEQARARLQQNKQTLTQLGLTPQQIDAFDPTPENIEAVIAQAMDLKTAIDQADKDRNFELRKSDTEADNRRGDQQLEISRGQLGVSQGNLSQRRAEHSERKAQGGYAGPAKLPSGFILDN